MISEMGTGKYVCAGTDNKNVRLFENYNYTVYVPHNDSIRFLIDSFIAQSSIYKLCSAVAKLASPVVSSATEYAANDAALVIAGISWELTNCAIGIISFALKWVSANGMQAPTVSTNMWHLNYRRRTLAFAFPVPARSEQCSSGESAGPPAWCRPVP